MKKPKLDTDAPSCVLIVESPQLKLFSVQINSKHNRVFVVQSSSDFVCHSEKCKEKRAVHVASGIPFSCEHCNLLKSFSSPTLAKNIHEVITQLKECCWKPLNLLKILGMSLKFLKVVMPFIMVLPRAHLTPRGIVMYRSVMDCSAAQTRAVQGKVAIANS